MITYTKLLPRFAALALTAALALAFTSGCSWMGRTAGKAQAKVERKIDAVEQGYDQGYKEEKGKSAPKEQPKESSDAQQ